ncbi:MAG: helix-turn-helix domain-containing protein [Patescibacteria group bacterium]
MAAVFKKKKITATKRICLRLKEARKERGVNLTALSKKTRISKKHLRAIEACEFDKLPKGEIYQKNFVKKYLEAINIEPAPFLRQFIEEEINYTKNTERAAHPKKHIQNISLSNIPSIIRFALAALVVIAFVTYLAVQVKNIIEPPELTLLAPQNGYVSNQSTVTVQGKTEKETGVSINDKKIITKKDGQFNEIINLVPGLNTIVVTAEKKHGKKTSETRYVVLKE